MPAPFDVLSGVPIWLHQTLKEWGIRTGRLKADGTPVSHFNRRRRYDPATAETVAR
jgi:hypothetical protein